MIVYRLSKKQWAKDLTGTGAWLNSGRWNKLETAMVYTSINVALALLEITVHIPPGMVPTDYELVTISVPDTIASQSIELHNLREDWSEDASIKYTQELGDSFINNKEAALLKVPSAIVFEEHNILLNPLHPDFKEVQLIDIQPFRFDRRLFMRR